MLRARRSGPRRRQLSPERAAAAALVPRQQGLELTGPEDS
ncbi:hypothetical protein FHX42_002273 [Saccharopolyspora lacisalsi]|uniref:Uncharacterized protein n=1 Tax=Halosaccharopolyspora lacisalsi TaxID=1000566 RepID=A0A839DXH6_9PSEU|nr:hypothetical protein [Halosaccharopolyspora lacisalsi]